MIYISIVLWFGFTLTSCASATSTTSEVKTNSFFNNTDIHELVRFEKRERLFNQNKILGLISIEPKAGPVNFAAKSTSYYGLNAGKAKRLINLWTHLSDFKDEKGQSKDPMKVAAGFLQSMNVSGTDAVIVSTSVYLDDAVYIESKSNHSNNIWGVFITLGIGNTISVFDLLEKPSHDLAGTINTTLITDAKLGEQVYLSLISKVSEVKVSTLHSLNIKSRKAPHNFAIGTNSDTITIASTESGKDLKYFGYNDIDYNLISKLISKAIAKSVQNYCTRIHSNEYKSQVMRTENKSANYTACNEINVQQLQKLMEQ